MTMNLKKHFFFACAITFTLIACDKKDDDDIIITPPPATTNPTVNDYAKLDVGNYWIYERYNIDTNGIETALGVFDSSYVEKDTIINGNKYSVLIIPQIYNNTPSHFIIRDSSDYIVDNNGEIHFSLTDFSSFLQDHYYVINNTDTMYRLFRQMRNKDSLVTVPSGTYETYNALQKVDFIGPYNQLRDKYRNKLYAKNIGIIYNTQTQYSANPNSPVQKLVRYYVK